MSDVDTELPAFDSETIADVDAVDEAPCSMEPDMARHNISIEAGTLDRMKAEADRRMTSPHMLFQKGAEMFLAEYEGKPIF